MSAIPNLEPKTLQESKTLHEQDLKPILKPTEVFFSQGIRYNGQIISIEKFVEEIKKRRPEATLKNLLDISSEGYEAYLAYSEHVYKTGNYSIKIDSKTLLEETGRTMAGLDVRDLGGALGFHLFVNDKDIQNPILLMDGFIMHQSQFSKVSHYYFPLDNDNHEWHLVSDKYCLLGPLVGHSWAKGKVIYKTSAIENEAATPNLTSCYAYLTDLKIVCVVLVHVDLLLKKNHLFFNQDKTLKLDLLNSKGPILKRTNLVTISYGDSYWIGLNFMPENLRWGGSIISDEDYTYPDLFSIRYRSHDSKIMSHTNIESWNKFCSRYAIIIGSQTDTILKVLPKTINQYKTLKHKTRTLEIICDLYITEDNIQKIIEKLQKILGDLTLANEPGKVNNPWLTASKIREKYKRVISSSWLKDAVISFDRIIDIRRALLCQKALLKHGITSEFIDNSPSSEQWSVNHIFLRNCEGEGYVLYIVQDNIELLAGALHEISYLPKEWTPSYLLHQSSYDSSDRRSLPPSKNIKELLEKFSSQETRGESQDKSREGSSLNPPMLPGFNSAYKEATTFNSQSEKGARLSKDMQLSQGVRS